MRSCWRSPRGPATCASWARSFLLPLVVVLALVSFFAGLLVRTPPRFWKVRLGVFALPTLGVLSLNFQGAFHETKLVHEEMIASSAISLFLLLLAYCVFRPCRALGLPRNRDDFTLLRGLGPNS